MTLLGLSLLGWVMKGLFWITNRVAAWTGSFYLWRLGRRTNRKRYYVWAVVFNLVLWGLLVGLFWWLTVHAKHKG